MFKKNDLIKVVGLKELDGVTLKINLVSTKLKSYIVKHNGINYTIPFEYAERL